MKTSHDIYPTHDETMLSGSMWDDAADIAAEAGYDRSAITGEAIITHIPDRYAGHPRSVGPDDRRLARTVEFAVCDPDVGDDDDFVWLELSRSYA